MSNMFEFSSWPREANFSPKFRRTREETTEQTASRGILLSSLLTCAAGFREYFTVGCSMSLFDKLYSW